VIRRRLGQETRVAQTNPRHATLWRAPPPQAFDVPNQQQPEVAPVTWRPRWTALVCVKPLTQAIHIARRSHADQESESVAYRTDGQRRAAGLGSRPTSRPASRVVLVCPSVIESVVRGRNRVDLPARVFSAQTSAKTSMADATGGQRPHAFIIYITLRSGIRVLRGRETAFALEDRLHRAVEDAGLREYDGHEFGQEYSQFSSMVVMPTLLADTLVPVVSRPPPSGRFFRW
jgi:hypothetical protein